MRLKWIAERLAMGSWSNVSNLLAAGKKNLNNGKSVKSETLL